MKKIIAIAALAAVVAACSPDKAGLEATLVITETNAKDLAAGTMDMATNSSDLADIDSLTRSNGARSSAARTSQSISSDCESGSYTMTVTADDSIANATTLPASGSMSVDSDYDQCVLFGEETDGGLYVDFSWSGFNDIDVTFGTVTSSVAFDEFTVTSANEDSMIDGDMNVTLTQSTLTIGWDFYASATEFSNQTIHTYTKTKVLSNLADTYPTQGVWRVDGAEDTYIEATVVANGIEVVVNGGQPILYTWDEL